MRTLSVILSLILFLVFSGCASMDKRTKCIVEGAVLGAAIGAGSGAVIGHQGDTDNATEGSLIGAAVGGIVGGTIGCFYCKAEVNLDADGDGVPDDADNCPGTPTGVKVDEKGCPLDSDGDGVPDYRDKCPNTPAGTKVDSDGCPPDSDGDGIYDDQDQCPDTPKGATVNKRGCWAFGGNVFFEVNKSDIRSDAHPLLNEAVKILKENSEVRVEIQGHTDSTGPEAYNQILSEKRAKAINAYLVKEGIDAERLEVKGYGESDPIASNDTAEGRQQNRRVRFKRIQN
ncbi:MAG: OmpA family protein [Deltaproteobacteria bacterium]|nr:OmpA family protein [Deltaproteobacteria bacterium]